MKITDNLVKSLSSEASLSQIKRLDLSDKGISGPLDTTVLQNLKNLNVLDVSQNDITEIPESFSLPNLETIDCSYNDLKSLKFVDNFKNCKQLYVDGNDSIELSEKVKLFRMHPSIDYIDDIRRSTVDNFREKWEVMVKSKWEVLFAAKYAEGFEDGKFETVLQEFYMSLITDQLFKNIHDEKEKAILKDLAAEIVERAQDKTLFVDSTNSKGTPRSARLNHKWLNREEESNPSTPCKSTTSKSKPSTPKSERSTPVSKPSQKRGRESSPTDYSEAKPAKRAREKSPTNLKSHPVNFTALKNRENGLTQLPSVGDYDPVFFVRCHSVTNDPSDEKTKVWRCAFEPSINGASSQILATCGGQNVCLIDCQTGKVMKRYKDNSKEEDFYALAWSTIPYRLENKEDRTNILAVAGNNGYIKLIHPSQFVMYATMEGHHDYISCLLFHPTEPTYLFSGSKDRKIIMWDVGVPDFTDYTTSYKKLLTLNTPHTDALNLIYNPQCKMLVAGCEKSCYGWRFKDFKNVSRNPDVEFMIPSSMSDVESGGSDDVEVVDGLTMLPNNYIASKCNGSGHIIIWNLHDNLPTRYIKGTRIVEVKMSARLEYTKTCVDYINLGSTSGFLTAGDDKGSVYIYSMDYFTQRPDMYADQEVTYSLKLEWPEIETGSYKEKMKELCDDKIIVVNSCCTSVDNSLIACGTDNNLVCIWKKNSQIVK